MTREENTGLQSAVRGFTDAWQAPVCSDAARLRLALGGTAAASLAANAFSYFNFVPQHDALIESYWAKASWQVKLGRFLLPVYLKVRGNSAMPWVAGMLCILFLGLSVYLITKAMGMDSPAEILLTSGFLSANLTVTIVNALFQYFSDAFMCSLFFACLGVFLIREKTGALRGLLACLCFFLCVGIYPAYILVSLCLFMGLILRAAADGSGLTKELWKKIGFWVLVLAVAAGAYLAASRLALSVVGRAAAKGKNSIFTLGSASPAKLIYQTGVNYYFFLSTLFLGFSPAHGFDYLGVPCGIAASLLAAVCVISFCRRHKGRLPKGVFALFFLAAAVFPLVTRAVNIMMGNGSALHTIFAQYMLFPLLLWAFFRRGGDGDDKEVPRAKPAAVIAVTVLSVLLLLGNIRFSNNAYTIQKVLYDRAVYHTGQVISDLRDAGYVKDSDDRVIVSGSFDLGDDMAQQLKTVTCMNGFKDTSVTYTDTFRYMTMLLGSGITEGSIKDMPDADAAQAYIDAMPAYPALGYLQEIDGYYLVKLS